MIVLHVGQKNNLIFFLFGNYVNVLELADKDSAIHLEKTGRLAFLPLSIQLFLYLGPRLGADELKRLVA